VVFMKVQDLVFYMIGSGEYDELMRAHLLNTPEPITATLAEPGDSSARRDADPCRLNKCSVGQDVSSF
jgi:hypothetical protein